MVMLQCVPHGFGQLLEQLPQHLRATRGSTPSILIARLSLGRTPVAPLGSSLGAVSSSTNLTINHRKRVVRLLGSWAPES